MTQLTNLDLCVPLFFSKIEDFPLDTHKDEEFLFLYEINPEQGNSIEPVRELLLGRLTFIGKRTDDSVIPDTEKIILPAGKYLFTQKRSSSAMLKQEDWLDMAIEQQKDALWERNEPGNRLYVRVLYEDGLFVTQLFRNN